MVRNFVSWKCAAWGVLNCSLFFFICFCRGGWETEGFVQDIEGTVETLESINELFFGDGERWCTVDMGESVQSDQSLIDKGLLVLEKGFTGGLVLKLGVLALGVLDIETTKESNGSVLFNGGMVLDQLLHAGLEERSNCLRSSDNVVLQEVLGVFVGNGHGNGVSRVGAAPSHRLVFKEVQDFFVARHHRHGDRGGRDALCAGDNVGHDSFVVLESKHFSGTSETHHDLVDVHQNSVLVAESTNTLQEPVGEDHATTGSEDTFGHDGGNVVGAFVEDLFLEHDEGGLDLLRFGGVAAAGLEKEREGIEGLDKARSFLSEPAAGIASGGTRVSGSSVVGSVPANDLLFAGKASGHHDSGLVGLGSTAGVYRGSQISGKDFVHELVHAGFDLGLANVAVGVGQSSHLVRSGFDDGLGQVVSEIGADRLRCPVEVSVSLVVKQVDTFSVGHVGDAVSGSVGSPSHRIRIVCS